MLLNLRLPSFLLKRRHNVSYSTRSLVIMKSLVVHVRTAYGGGASFLHGVLCQSEFLPLSTSCSVWFSDIASPGRFTYRSSCFRTWRATISTLSICATNSIKSVLRLRFPWTCSREYIVCHPRERCSRIPHSAFPLLRPMDSIFAERTSGGV